MAEQLRTFLDANKEEQLRRFLRLQEVRRITGMSRSWIYDAIRRGDFPAPIPLSARAVAWDSAAIADWQARRIEQSRKAAS